MDRGAKESGRGKSRSKIRELLADVRCRQAVLDFLSTTDVGSLAGAGPAEEERGGGASEWEPRERREL